MEVLTMFLNALRNEFNKTTTWNGAPAFKSTKSDILDLYAVAGNARSMGEDRLADMIGRAMAENAELAIRVVFYLADIRGGQGSRDTLRAALKFLVRRYPTQARGLIAMIPEYSRWDMLYEFVGTELERDAFAVLKNEVKDAIKNKRNSLVFKWLKSVNTSSDESNRLGRLTAKYFGMNERDYRKMLSKYRAELGIVEVVMSADEWNAIDYEKLPSKAGLQYREAFKRHDLERYQSYLKAVIRSVEDDTAPKVKMNMTVAYPHEVVGKYRNAQNGWRSQEIGKVDLTLEAAWKSLVDYFEGNNENILAVVDVSGSMYSLIGKSDMQNIDLSVGLGIYCAEHMNGELKNNYMTFSDEPQLVRLNPNATLRDKINQVYSTGVGYSTNVDAVFKKLLDVAKKNRLSQSDLPTTVLMISDMQFNSSNVRGVTNYEMWVKMFEQAGYKLPQIVFWNVAAAESVPVTMDQKGTVLVSGASPVVLKFIFTGELLTPYDLMLKVVNQVRYSPVAELFHNPRA